MDVLGTEGLADTIIYCTSFEENNDNSGNGARF